MKSQCKKCIHYYGYDDILKCHSCVAFLDIPEEIYSGKVKHDHILKDEIVYFLDKDTRFVFV